MHVAEATCSCPFLPSSHYPSPLAYVAVNVQRFCPLLTRHPLCMAAPRSCLATQSRRSGNTVAAHGSQARAAFSAAAAAPRQPAEPLVAVAVARRRRRSVFGLGEVVLFFHAEESLLFFDALAVDAAAAHRAIHTETTPRASHARR
jgi:hypothetical protein